MLNVDDLILMDTKDIKAGRKLLCREFEHDPQFHKMLKPEQDQSNLEPLFDYILRSGIKAGGILVKDSEDMKGIALVVPAGIKSAWAECSFGGFVNMLWKYRFATVKLLSRLNKRSREIHGRLVQGKHYYLSIIGVEPRCQGQGVGKKILLQIIKGVDQEQMPLYLETQNQKNVSIYRKYGFEVVHEEAMTPFFYDPVYFMLRMPT
jgi:ribosomal protein S18 acetylase RimI-like enzyme